MLGPTDLVAVAPNFGCLLLSGCPLSCWVECSLVVSLSPPVSLSVVPLTSLSLFSRLFCFLYFLSVRLPSSLWLCPTIINFACEWIKGHRRQKRQHFARRSDCVWWEWNWNLWIQSKNVNWNENFKGKSVKEKGQIVESSLKNFYLWIFQLISWTFKKNSGQENWAKFFAYFRDFWPKNLKVFWSLKLPWTLMDSHPHFKILWYGL